jgi:xanthine dehydrogenase/oxidase
VSAGHQDVFDENHNVEVTTQEPHIGTANPHVSGLNQSTGVAKFLDDVPPQHGELHVGFVLSKRAHAVIKSIDASRALALPGVHEFVSSKDLPSEHNLFGFMKDEEIFASKEVKYNG